MGILSWIIFGLIAGILAKWIMPGKDGGGFIVTVILGIIGAVVGGWISTLFGFGKVDGFNLSVRWWYCLSTGKCVANFQLLSCK